MKHIYRLFLALILNALVINTVSAQKQWCYTNYTVASIAYNPVLPYNSGTQIHYNVIANPNVPFPFIDSLSDVIPIGFNFNFYGNYYSSLLISTVGYLTFDTNLANAPNSAGCEYHTPQANSIYLFANNMDPELFGAIKYSTIGTAPNRQFVVSYDSVATPVSTTLSVDSGILTQNYVWSYCTGQIVLYETTDNIDMYTSHAEVADGCGELFQAVENINTSLSVWSSIKNNGAWRFTQTNLPYPTPNPICIVSVDSATDKNIVIWNKTAVASVDSFIIYKETNVAGVYAQIGVQPYSAFSTFIDTGSNPAQQANRYKLGFRDSCGVIAVQSAVHKTVHLSISQGIGNTWNLGWDAYEGFSFGSYYLYRGTTPSNMSLLTTIASNLYSYTDLNPPTGTVYYVIGVDNPDPCTPARIASGGSFSNSLSNIVNNKVTGIQSIIDETSINIYPNPVSETATIQFKLNTKTDLNVVMSDMTGRIVYSELYKDVTNLFEQKIDCSNLARGVYFLQLHAVGWTSNGVKTEAGSYNRKIVVD